MSNIHYCIECNNSKEIQKEGTKTIIDFLVCIAIRSKSTKEYGLCDAVRGQTDFCHKYEAKDNG